MFRRNCRISCWPGKPVCRTWIPQTLFTKRWKLCWSSIALWKPSSRTTERSWLWIQIIPAYSAASVAVASGHHSRAPATFEEQQSVPAAPESFPSNFVSCPTCGGAADLGYRCHGFPHVRSQSSSRTTWGLCNYLFHTYKWPKIDNCCYFTLHGPFSSIHNWFTWFFRGFFGCIPTQLCGDYIFHKLGGGNSKIFNFHPYLEKWSNLTSICFKWVGSTTNQINHCKDPVMKQSIICHGTYGNRFVALFWGSPCKCRCILGGTVICSVPNKRFRTLFVWVLEVIV